VRLIFVIEQGTRIACGQGEQEGHPYHGREEARSSMVGVPLAGTLPTLHQL
jgi:hypothetical protein